MTCQVVQVLANNDYTVIVYFADGAIRKYDVSHIVGKGVFEPLADIEWFVDRCTVLNGTVAWDLSGRFDPRNCLDIDPDVIYQDGTPVSDPLESLA